MKTHKLLVNPQLVEQTIAKQESQGKTAKHVGFKTAKYSRNSQPKKFAVIAVTFHNYHGIN